LKINLTINKKEIKMSKNYGSIIKNLLGGADKKIVHEVALVVVDAMTRIMGEPYQLVPVNASSTSTKIDKPIKKAKRWGRQIQAIDYSARPTGYAIKGDWANVFDLSKHTDGTLVMISIPNAGLFMGEVKANEVYSYEYPNGGKGEIKHFKQMYGTDEGMYVNIINECKARAVPDHSKEVKAV
jgi:hypothetical protein